MRISRRGLVTGIAGIGLASTVAPYRARAADGPIRIGLLTVKTGPLASGGIDMERALMMFLKERDYTMAGRKVDFTGRHLRVEAAELLFPLRRRARCGTTAETSRPTAAAGPGPASWCGVETGSQ